MIHSSFINSRPLGEGETYLNCRVENKTSHLITFLFSLSPHTNQYYCFDGNSDRGFPALSSPMMRYFSSLGGFSLSDYNKFWDGCTSMFSALPPYFLRHFDASTHLSLSSPGLLQNCNSYTKKVYSRLLHFFPISYINLPNV